MRTRILFRTLFSTSDQALPPASPLRRAAVLAAVPAWVLSDLAERAALAWLPLFDDLVFLPAPGTVTLAVTYNTNRWGPFFDAEGYGPVLWVLAALVGTAWLAYRLYRPRSRLEEVAVGLWIGAGSWNLQGRFSAEGAVDYIAIRLPSGLMCVPNLPDLICAVGGVCFLVSMFRLLAARLRSSSSASPRGKGSAA